MATWAEVLVMWQQVSDGFACCPNNWSPGSERCLSLMGNAVVFWKTAYHCLAS